MLKNILFDLDGTLLPMEQELFIKDYFGRIAKHLAPFGYAPDKLISAIWGGTKEMTKNDGTMLNEARFWLSFKEIFGEAAPGRDEQFESFYINEFDKVRASCGFNPEAASTVKALKERGYRLILATNPLFPTIATEKRAAWAGLDVSDFELITTYENSSYCKPNLDYYREIVNKCCIDPAECLMVGNDVGEDMVAEKLGMKVFLLTDCLINKSGEDISKYPNGTLGELLEFVNTL